MTRTSSSSTFYSHSLLSLSCLLLVSLLLLLLSPSILSVAADDSAAQLASHLYASALTLQVEPREEQCFYEDLEAGKNFRLEFEVVRGGLLDIKLKINDPNNNVVIDKMAFFNRQVYTHTHDVPIVSHAIRFTATHAPVSLPVVITSPSSHLLLLPAALLFLSVFQDDAANEAEGRVQFNAAVNGPYKICFDNTMSRWTAKVVSFFVLNDAVKNSHEEIAKLEHLGPVVDSVIKIADELDSIEQIQHHTRIREQSHRDGESFTISSLYAWLPYCSSYVILSDV